MDIQTEHTAAPPLVSIVMPSYNCAPYIEQSIRSVQAQTYKHWELIVVDDCSTDDGVERVAHMAQADSRIRLIQFKQNMGTAKSRNTALEQAKGRYIAFLDADDLWRPEKLEKQIAFMQQNAYAFSYHIYDEIDETGAPLGVRVSGKAHLTKWDLMSCCWPGCLTVMYDTEVMGLVQINDVRKNNDSAIWIQAAERADCYLLPENLGWYRRRVGSITPTTIWRKIVWHYFLFRQSIRLNPILALFWTGVNILVNSYKKLFYVKRYNVSKETT